ncbi:MAG TPA: SPFH domain-containing protein [Burkholderiales bacterium]|nr:SPFH domain-containing protein [Burkholderiales bacterium]
MLQRLRELIADLGRAISRFFYRVMDALSARRVVIAALALLAAIGYAMYQHPPVKTVARGELGVRYNRLTGGLDEWREGSALVLPGLHDVRVFALRDQVYRPAESSRADGPAPFQSIEGLSLGVDLSVRYALDAARLRAVWSRLPDDVGADVVQPAVASVVYKILARYTVREIFSGKRAEIQQAIETELAPKLAADGVALRDVLIGKVDLPPDYKRGLEALLAEELASEKMRFTLELKEKRVRESELEAEALRVRREKAAEASALEQVIAARGQDEAMKHVLPLKQRQVEQRRLEAEAERVAQIRRAKGSAQARRIEADGEASARQRLADAEAYRLEKVGRANAAQMEREGALVSRHPLLIQKTLADKLSDKIQVIIAPPPADQGFIGATLLGGGRKP